MSDWCAVAPASSDRSIVPRHCMRAEQGRGPSPGGPVSSPVLDCLVVGAGPAGLQLGQHLAEAGRDYLVLEAGSSPGTFFRTFPRHRRLISINKVHTGTDDPELNLRMDWNSLLSPDPRLLLRHYSSRYFPDAGDLARYLADYADALALNVRYNTRVARIGRVEQGFEVATA